MLTAMSESPSLFDMRALHPGKHLRRMIAEKGWTQEELASVTGISRQTIHAILAGRSNISPETAAKLAAALGNKPEEWLKWDALFRLSILEAQDELAHVSKMSWLYQLAPVKEMIKRDWICATDEADVLEQELKHFFGSESLREDLNFPVAASRAIKLPYLNLAEKAWCFRARQLSSSMAVGIYDPSKLDHAESKLRKLAAFPKEVRHVPQLLAEYGIRFLIVEPLATVKIDGAAFWINDEPTIALSLRHDRIDGFWFTLMHEFAHICNNDAFSADTDLIDGTKGIAVTLVHDEFEARANRQAVAALLSKSELDSFVRRVGPYYSRDRIIQFANKMKIHPGIIVGQLQHRNELGYSALRDLLVKVREIVTSTALTDGWNQSIAPAVL